MSRVYLDTNGFAYYFDRHPLFGSIALETIERAMLPKHRLFSSLFGLSEVRIKAFQQREEFKLALIDRFFRSSAVVLLPYTLEAVSTYTNLRAHNRVKPVNALHLACAATAGVDLFLTNDTKLHRITIPGIGAVAPLDTLF